MESEAPNWSKIGSSLHRTSPVLDASLISPNGDLDSAASPLPAHYFTNEENRERLRLMLDAFPHMVWTTDAEGHAEYYNYGWIQFTGRPEADLLRTGMFDVLHPEDRQVVIAAWMDAVTCRRPFDAEVRILRNDGVYRNCSVRANPILGPTGEIERWIGTTTDVHEQRELEQERYRLLEQNLKQREHLRSIIRNVPGVVWEAWASPDIEKQQIDFVSSYVEEMLGYTIEEWLATPNFWLTIVHPEDRERAAHRARELFESRTSGVNKFRWITKEGKTIWVEAFSSVLLDDTGRAAGMCGVSIDISARQRSDDERVELAMRVEEERARIHRVINAVPGIVWEMSPTAETGSLSFVSDQVETLTGYTTKDFQHGKAQELLSSAEFERAIAQLKSVGDNNEVVFDLTLRHAAGHHVTLESHVIRSGEGASQRLNGVSFDVTHERGLARTAARGEQLLHVIADNLPALLCYIDKDERYRFANLSHRQWWKRSPEDILGKTIEEVTGHEFYDTVRHHYKRALAGEELQSEHRFVHEGKVHHFQTSFIPHLEGAEVLGVTVLSQDITERVEAEIQLKESEERLRAIADNAPAMLWLSDERGQRFFFNRQWYEHTGSTPEQNLGDAWQQFIDKRDIDRLLRIYRESTSNRANFQTEYRLRHHSGDERWVLALAQPRFSATGAFIGYIGSCTDISAQKQAEIAILRSHEHFRQLAESMPHIVWTARPDGTGEYWNRFWFDYTGLTEEQCQRPVLRDGVFQPEDLKNAIRLWKEGIANVAPIEFEIRIRRASDGEYRWHFTRTVPVIDAAGNLISWVGSVIDVHDQKTVHEELRAARDAADAANQAKDHFLATLSHELRTPLTPVLTTIETLELDEHLPPGVEVHIATIRRNVELEARLIDDLLDLTRITRGKIHLSMRPVEVHGLLANVLEICRRDITAKRIDVHLGLHAQRTYISADPARLQQILWNVLQNAVKFTPPEGRISVRTLEVENRLRIEITDSGIGIEAARLPLIFKPFEQGAVEITKQFGGLGLGLAITKMLVDIHDGAITATSEGTHCGSTFSIEFGLVETPATGGDVPKPERRFRRESGPNKILLVDDHLDTAAAIRILLERRGYQISLADSMQRAIDTYRSDTFDLVISDIGLPDGTGWQLISTLNEHSPVHAIALSGFCTEQDIERSMDAGFDIHLTKPFNFADLQGVIEKLLDERARELESV